MFDIPCGVSARHIHLSEEHVEVLFGKNYKFIVLKETYNPGFVTHEKVRVLFLNGRACEMHIVFPTLENTQIELSTTDCYKFKIEAPKNYSGDVSGGAGAMIVNPETNKGIFVEHCAIRPIRHLHLNNNQAFELGLRNNDIISVEAGNVIFNGVQVRVKDSYRASFHIDTDEGNAAGIDDKSKCHIIKPYDMCDIMEGHAVNEKD